MRPSLLAATALLCLGLIGCSKNPEKAEKKAEGNVCSQLANVGVALEQSAALTPTSTVGEAEAAGKALRKTLKQLKTSETQLEQLRLDDFNAKAKAFRKDVAAVAKDKKMTLEAAAGTLKAKAAPVIAAHKALSASVNCDQPAAAPAKP